jgi:hypothetical protein
MIVTKFPIGAVISVGAGTLLARAVSCRSRLLRSLQHQGGIQPTERERIG